MIEGDSPSGGGAELELSTATSAGTNDTFVCTGRLEKVQSEKSISVSASVKNEANLTPRKSLDALKNPWVPAPAKSSHAQAIVETSQSQSRMTIASTSSSLNSSFKGKLKKFGGSVGATKGRSNPKGKSKFDMNRSQQSREKRVPALKKSGGRRKTTSGYKLKTKDSLVDVTACLQAKREEVMQLWENTLQKDDPGLLVQIETANRLALEAAEEVEMLRKTIQDFQKKERGLTDADCQCLEDMRAKVLEKVKEFEGADNVLQENIAQKSASKLSIQSVASRTSQTDENDKLLAPSSSNVYQEKGPTLPTPTQVNPSLPSTSTPRSTITKEVVFLKEKPEYFSDESISDDENDNNEPKQFPIFKDKSTVNSGGISAETLSQLKLLYEENFTFPPFPKDAAKPARSQSSNFGLDANYEQHVRMTHQQENTPNQFQQQRTVRFSECEMVLEENSNCEELYREKIAHLQRKLMDTEQEVEELKSEIERIESDASFRVRILQNSVQDKFDSLKAIPEYLQMVDLKLTESVQLKTQLERELHNSQLILQEEQAANKSLRKEITDLQNQLRTSENCKDFLSFKNSELENSNAQLKHEVAVITKQIAEMAGQIHNLKANDTMGGSSFVSPRSPRVSYENQKLKLQISELKAQVAQSKQIIQTLRKSKDKLATDSNDKIEELMTSLEQAQHQRRTMADQIRLLKKSYNEMFPFEILFAQDSSPDQPTPRGHQKKGSKRKPVSEPKIEAKFAWKTGDIEDLLKLPIKSLSKAHVSFEGKH